MNRQPGDGQQEDRLTVIHRRVPPDSQANDAIVLTAAGTAGVCGVLFGLALLLRAPLAVTGGALAIGLFALAIGVRRYFTSRFVDVEAVEPRVPMGGATDDEGDDLPLSDVPAVGRRPLLVRALAAAAGMFGLGLLAPVASLGPAPTGQLRTTAWRRGLRLVDSEGEPIRPGDVAAGGVSTVWPEGEIGNEDSAVILVRLSRAEPQPPTVLDWVIDGELVAYSKICTHAGCPVGLFRERDAALFCPCHQSTFDAARGAVPTFGPAARALPQLPMAVDENGFLYALDDFRAQVGPAFG